MQTKEASLPNFVLQVVKGKGTEAPYSGEYDQFWAEGSYLCRLCGLALFRSNSKFHSGCGWPSFDEELENAVLRKPDSDGLRTEILCARCHAHLGHVFSGELLSPKNIRHCVNSLSLDFVPDKKIIDTEEAFFAAGCFWGVEYYFKRCLGVLKTEVGYMGGTKANPTYEEVCTGKTGHFEAIRVIYDPSKINYESLCQYFFEIHDPTEKQGQGPDQGEQYLSVAFFYNDNQKNIIEKLISFLKSKGYPVATQIKAVTTFWPAELYHQDYYEKTRKMPYCHHYEKRF